jgi:fructose-1,6-bisphosphatase
MEGIYAFADQIKVYKAILDATQEIQEWLRYHSVNLVALKNEFGKVQSNIDLEANDIIYKHLKTSGVIFGYASEESAKFNSVSEGGEYFVTFDPIDGSSVIDCNFSVGSIYGIWNTKDLEGKTGRILVGAALAVYGTRTTICIYNA